MTFCLIAVMLAPPVHAQVRGVEGIRLPYALALDGSLLYASSFWFDGTRTIYVLDVGEPGAEHIIDSFPSPVIAIDMRVINGKLFMVDAMRNTLYIRLLDAQQWIDIPLTASNEVSAGPALVFMDGLLYVVHQRFHYVDVVNPETLTVDNTFSLASESRIAITNGYLAALGIGLEQPVCDAFGPTLSLYTFPDLQEVWTIDAHGDCPMMPFIDGELIHVVYYEQIRTYDLEGNLLITVPTNHTYYHGALVDGGLVAVTEDGDIVSLPSDGTRICQDLVVVRDEQRASPALASVVAAPPEDGRVFIANTNDDSVSIVEGLPGCD